MKTDFKKLIKENRNVSNRAGSNEKLWTPEMKKIAQVKMEKLNQK